MSAGDQSVSEEQWLKQQMLAFGQKLELLTERQEHQISLIKDVLDQGQKHREESESLRQDMLGKMHGIPTDSAASPTNLVAASPTNLVAASPTNLAAASPTNIVLSDAKMRRAFTTAVVNSTPRHHARPMAMLNADSSGPEIGAQESAVSSEAASSQPPRPSNSSINMAVTLSEVGPSQLASFKQARDRLVRIVNGDMFELFWGILILANTVCMAAEQQYQGQLVAYEMGFASVKEPGNWATAWFKALEYFFTVAFLVELLLRLGVLHMDFFRSKWNWLDLIIVSFSVINFLYSSFLVDPVMMRLVRLLKLTRLLRMLRVAGLLDQLNFLLNSILASRSTLFWSVLMLMVIQGVFGMILFQMVYIFLSNPDNSEAMLEKKGNVFVYYGTFTKTMITMFEVTHVNYSRAARVLQENISESYAWMFIVYRIFVTFAALQVIRSVFIQQTLKVAEKDTELARRKRAKDQEDYRLKLEQAFSTLCGASTDELTIDQFRSALSQEAMQAWMTALDINSEEVDELFRLLDGDGNGGVTIQEFMKGAVRLKGQARSIDLFQLSSQITKMERVLEKQVEFMHHFSHTPRQQHSDPSTRQMEGVPAACSEGPAACSL